MSTPTPYEDRDDDELEPKRRGTSTVIKTIAGVAAAGVLAFGASTAASKISTSNSSAAAGAPVAQSGASGAPSGGRGFGTPVTGDTLTKLKSVVTAKYAGASVEQAMKLQDGSYEVHVIQSSGTEVHVLVSAAFKITGTEQGGGPGGTPPAGTQS